VKKNHWLITQQQIADCDIDTAIIRVDPEQIPDAEIPGLQGAVRLRVEGVKGPADVFGTIKSRRFFRALFARWPYAGFFLRLKPISKDSSKDQIIDVSMYMALALCHVSELTLCQTPKGMAIRYNMDQLRVHLAEVAFRAIELADVVGIPKEEIVKRDKLITASITSFSEAGLRYIPKSNRRNQ
jgi:hypothetical protein